MQAKKKEELGSGDSSSYIELSLAMSGTSENADNPLQHFTIEAEGIRSSMDVETSQALKESDKKLEAMSTKTDIMAFKAFMQKSYSDPNSPFHHAFIHEMMNVAFQACKIDRRRLENEFWSYPHPDSFVGVVTSCCGFHDEYKNYKWEKGNFPPVHGDAIPTKEDFRQTEKGKDFFRRIKSLGNSKDRMCNIMERIVESKRIVESAKEDKSLSHGYFTVLGYHEHAGKKTTVQFGEGLDITISSSLHDVMNSTSRFRLHPEKPNDGEEYMRMVIIRKKGEDEGMEVLKDEWKKRSVESIIASMKSSDLEIVSTYTNFLQTENVFLSQD